MAPSLHSHLSDARPSFSTPAVRRSDGPGFFPSDFSFSDASPGLYAGRKRVRPGRVRAVAPAGFPARLAHPLLRHALRRTLFRAFPVVALALFALFFLLILSHPLSAVHYSLGNESACACQFATFKLHAENLQAAPVHQDFLVQGADASVQGPPDFIHLELAALQSKIVPVDVYAACDAPAGGHDVSFIPVDPQSVPDASGLSADGSANPASASSGASPSGATERPAVSGSTNASLLVLPCNDIALDVTAQQTLCQNDHADYSVTVRNLSDLPRNVTLGTDLDPQSYVLPQRIRLEPHQSRTVVLGVNTNTLPQRLPFKVVAVSDDGARAEQPALIDVLACTGLRVSGPSDVSLVQGQSRSVTVQFQNIGATRTVRLEAFCPPFVSANVSTSVLGPSEKSSVAILIQSAPQGTYTCTLRASSPDDGRVFSHTFSITVTPSVARYSVSPLDFTLEQGTLQNLTFHVHNDGLLESVPVSFSSNATTPTAGPTHSTARADQDFIFFTNTDCHGYDLVLTHGGARRQCPEPSGGILRIGSQDVGVALHVRPASLVFDSKAYSVPSGLRVDFVLTNTGAATVLQLSGNPSSRGPATVPVAANSQAFFSVFIDGNQSRPSSYSLQARTDRGIYAASADLTHPDASAPTTGLVSFATPVIAFALAVLLALALLYLLYRRARIPA